MCGLALKLATLVAATVSVADAGAAVVPSQSRANASAWPPPDAAASLEQTVGVPQAQKAVDASVTALKQVTDMANAPPSTDVLAAATADANTTGQSSAINGLRSKTALRTRHHAAKADRAREAVPHSVEARSGGHADRSTKHSAAGTNRGHEKVALRVPVKTLTKTVRNFVRHGNAARKHLRSQQAEIIHAKIATAADAMLPQASLLLEKPTKAFRSLQSELVALRGKLHSTAQAGRAAVQAMKADYERRLQEQDKNTSVIKRTNHKLAERLATLTKKNSALKDRAGKLRSSGVRLTNQVASLNGNLSIAQEFIVDSLVKSRAESDELAVLRELDARDEAVAMETARARSLENLALLQFHVEEMPPALSHDFEELAQEQNASQTRLTESFEKAFHDEERLQEELLAQGEILKEKIESQTELHDKLVAVVSHLEAAQKDLEDKLFSLRSYSWHLGKFDDDVSHAMKKAKAKAKAEKKKARMVK